MTSCCIIYKELLGYFFEASLAGSYIIKMLRAALAVYILLVCFVGLAHCQKPPREYARSKCEKRTQNETLAAMCKTCVEQYTLTEYPSKEEIKSMIRTCIPRKTPKEWVKGKCEDNTENLEEIEACYLCIDSFELPQNVTRDDVRSMRRSCLPQPSLKFKAKRKCSKKLKNKGDIEACQECINTYNLSAKPSCEEVNEMKRVCVTERSGRELWTEPILQDDDDDEFL